MYKVKQGAFFTHLLYLIEYTEGNNKSLSISVTMCGKCIS